jgi:hypothetical protein
MAMAASWSLNPGEPVPHWPQMTRVFNRVVTGTAQRAAFPDRDWGD